MNLIHAVMPYIAGDACLSGPNKKHCNRCWCVWFGYDLWPVSDLGAARNRDGA